MTPAGRYVAGVAAVAAGGLVAMAASPSGEDSTPVAISRRRRRQ